MPYRYIIKEEKRLCALREDIVDAHGHRIYPDSIMSVHRKGDLELCPHTISAAHKHRLFDIECRKVEHPSERPDVSHHALA